MPTQFRLREARYEVSKRTARTVLCMPSLLSTNAETKSKSKYNKTARLSVLLLHKFEEGQTFQEESSKTNYSAEYFI